MKDFITSLGIKVLHIEQLPLVRRYIVVEGIKISVKHIVTTYIRALEMKHKNVFLIKGLKYRVLSNKLLICMDIDPLGIKLLSFEWGCV